MRGRPRRAWRILPSGVLAALDAGHRRMASLTAASAPAARLLPAGTASRAAPRTAAALAAVPWMEPPRAAATIRSTRCATTASRAAAMRTTATSPPSAAARLVATASEPSTRPERRRQSTSFQLEREASQLLATAGLQAITPLTLHYLKSCLTDRPSGGRHGRARSTPPPALDRRFWGGHGRTHGAAARRRLLVCPPLYATHPATLPPINSRPAAKPTYHCSCIQS